MGAYGRAPDPLQKTGDMASNWHSWKKDFIIFMNNTGYINKPTDVRANILKNRIGKVGIDAIQTITFDKPQDKDDMDILFAKLDEFFNPKNEVVERYKFFTRDKKQNETIEQYINILKEKAKTCNFKDTMDNVIRDKIISITQDKIILQKFFETKNLNLQKLVAIYNDYNINIEKMKQVTKEYTESTPKPPSTNRMKKCWRCDSHPQRKCPTCYSNNKKNHKANSVTKDMDPMNEKINFPDIPTVSCDTANSTFSNNRKFNFFRTIRGRKPKPDLYFDEVVIQSTYFGNNTQRNNAYVRRGPRENQRKKPIEMTPFNPPKHIIDAVLAKHKEITLLSSLMKKIE
ncbi:Retrotransposon gag domain-containing protein [Camponotus japonicus]